MDARDRDSRAADGCRGWIYYRRAAARQRRSVGDAPLRDSPQAAHELIPLRESFDPQKERLGLAKPSNLVLSLSKHAWRPRPALRQAQGEVVVASTVMHQHESKLSLVGMTPTGQSS